MFVPAVIAVAVLSFIAWAVWGPDPALSYGLVAAGLALSVTQMGGIGGRIAWGYVADRWLGARRMLLLLASMMALGALASAFLTAQTPQSVVVAILVAFGASAIGWNGVYLAEVARRAPPGMASMATALNATSTQTKTASTSAANCSAACSLPGWSSWPCSARL